MNIIRSAIRSGISGITRFWHPYSRIFMVSDSDHWVISWEMKEVSQIAKKLGKQVAPSSLLPFMDGQCVFLGSHFDLLLNDKWFHTSCRLATAYFHGRPGAGNREFDICFENLQKHHDQITRIQVSHIDMHNLVLMTGIDLKKVYLIPIGINSSYFTEQNPEMKFSAREKYGIPQQAVVIGSFQKDGMGWGEGMEPKLIKGPDIFIETLSLLKPKIPDLFVLLSGPARGYVKSELDKLNIPYKHCFLRDYKRIGELYHCLDIYLVASREEGGPKSILESMICGIPLVTTRVGQATDIVKHGENGWMVDIDDVNGLVASVEHILNHPEQMANIKIAALSTAKAHTYDAQIPLWSRFFDGFVE